MFKQILNCLTLIVVFVFVSCTKDIDFKQANDFEITPVIESSLIFLNEPANQFLDNGVEIESVQDSIEITLFNDQFIKDNLVKAEFVFETNNSINRGFRVRVDFFDETDQLVHMFTFNATASLTNKNIIASYTETFEASALDALKATRKMVFTLSLLAGTPISDNTIGNIQLKSKGVFYLNIDNSL